MGGASKHVIFIDGSNHTFGNSSGKRRKVAAGGRRRKSRKIISRKGT